MLEMVKPFPNTTNLQQTTLKRSQQILNISTIEHLIIEDNVFKCCLMQMHWDTSTKGKLFMGIQITFTLLQIASALQADILWNMGYTGIL